MEYSPNLCLGREGKVDHREFGLNSARDLVSASSWWAHRSDELNVLYLLEDFVLGAIEPAAVVHPLSEKFERRLREIGILFGHIQIVNVNDHFFSIRHHFSLGPPYHFAFDHILSFLGASLTGVDDIVDFPVAFVELG